MQSSQDNPQDKYMYIYATFFTWLSFMNPQGKLSIGYLNSTLLFFQKKNLAYYSYPIRLDSQDTNNNHNRCLPQRLA